MTDLFVKVNTHYKLQLPFAIYSKPNTDRIVGVFQKNDVLCTLEDYSECGFVLAPFEGKSIVLIPQDQSDVMVEIKKESDFYFQNEISFEEEKDKQFHFEELVFKGIREIEAGTFQKVVLSRKEILELKSFDLITVFQKLIAFYPTAFVYCFFHPKVGLWIGATPEQFLKIKEQTIETVALAGTQLGENPDSIVWPEKEKEEQQIVTDFIVGSLMGLTSEITLSNPYTTHAGILNHIKTDVSAHVKNADDRKEIVFRLHPTPAVCGFPKLEAKEFILENEGYDREYYAGFLGEWNIDLATFRIQQSDLFVNLRCMKIEDKKAHLFIGCGITRDSIPDKEYIETVNKSTTMKKVLDF